MSAKRKTMYRAAVYLRLSKEDGDVVTGSKSESNSISNQKDLIMDFLKSKPEIQVVSIREDDGYSGLSLERPALQKMLADVQQGTIDCIVVKDLSRFSRNYIDAGRYLEKVFPMLGVRFIAVNDHYDSEIVNAASDIIVPFKNLINDSYCRDLSIKIRSHLAVKRKNGEYTGAFACYGYLKDAQNKNHLVADPFAAQVVQDIFRWKLNGCSPNRIADMLNEQGILSPMEYKRSIGIRFETSFKMNAKARWSARAVLRILTNEVYTGVLLQGRQTTPNYKCKVRRPVDPEDWIRTENAHEAIIDPFYFRLVQKLMERDTRTSPNEDAVFPLAGLLYCGDCGSPMVRKTIYSNSKNKARRKYCYFVCRRHNGSGGCSWHRMKEKDLMEAVLQSVRLHIQTVLDMERAIHALEHADAMRFASKRYEARLAQKKDELSRAQSLKLGVYEDWKEGLLDQEEYLRLKKEFEDRVRQAKAAVDKLESERGQLIAPQESAWMQDFKRFGNLTELTRLAAVVVINRILVYEDGRIRIVFNFEDEYQQMAALLKQAAPSEKEAV